MVVRYSRLIVALLAAVSLLLLGSPAGGAQGATPQVSQAGKSHHAVCPGPAKKGTARCNADVRDDAEALNSVPMPAGSGGASPNVLGNGGVWQDRRTANICDRLRARKLDRVIRRKTGLVIDAYFLSLIHI